MPPFQRKAHLEALSDCAAVLQVDLDRMHGLWRDSGPQRFSGGFRSVQDNLGWIVAELGRSVDEAALKAAEQRYLAFTTAGLTPSPGALEALRHLRSNGVRLAVVSNCAPDVPQVWEHVPLAEFFDACAFSCRVGATKPREHIYKHALEAIGVAAQDALYIGDGSDQELTGAARCGMRAVLLEVDLSGAYDTWRADVEEWSGDCIKRLLDVPPMVTAGG